MVQVLPVRGNFGTGLLEGIGATGPEAFNQLLERKREQKGREAESADLQEAGYNVPASVRNPKLREALLEQQRKQQEFDADEQNLETIKDVFGEKFANVYKASPTGGRTELLKSGIEARLRGQDIKSLFDQLPDQAIPQEAKPGAEFPEYKLDTEGMTPKETISYQKELRGFNDPIFKEANKAKKAAKKSLNSFTTLDKLSDKIPQGLSRFFYDPTGNIRPLAQTLKLVPPEAEEYVKVINDFTTQAKDSFGSRVTNFDLQQFLRRLPTLANSKEGRKLIIDRMKLTTEADQIANQALEDVYRHYGLGKITQEDAVNLAEQLAESRLEKLRIRAEETDEQINRLSPEQPASTEGASGKKSLAEIFG